MTSPRLTDSQRVPLRDCGSDGYHDTTRKVCSGLDCGSFRGTLHVVGYPKILNSTYVSINRSYLCSHKLGISHNSALGPGLVEKLKHWSAAIWPVARARGGGSTHSASSKFGTSLSYLASDRTFSTHHSRHLTYRASRYR